ncbi:putative glycoside hydrolase [Anaerobacillus sp. CMMVII]|uniref:putative glycoside hydrolase n=1 Tax=Anaerobacillus sp. CMMVII TaxID=2755588 RepID=UPI0021B79D9B|nr:putative glycoside hydrolase [Anaerobacillus sp. CMMVII]MCT8140398.1 putative glycoside hydrolase [Anaerobacillus sp. CMMVII]
MGKRFQQLFTLFVIVTLVGIVTTTATYAEKSVSGHSLKQTELRKPEIPDKLVRFSFDSGFNFEYPDAVRGIYVTGHSAGGERLNSLIDLLDRTDLNTMVIDIKDDFGYLTYVPDEKSPYKDISQRYIKDPAELMKRLEEHQIYPIARIVVFKDSVLAEKRPDLSFTENGKVWKNRRGEAFVNPFLQEVWDYNVDIAIKAAKLGFQEIQFDYVRFPEGFERRDEALTYGIGDYQGEERDNVQKRVDAVTDFVAYAREKLEPYNVDVSVDIFGYSATISEAPGIGQNFSRISENVDVISSMIYPSHWTSYFGIAKPDLHPYELVSAYAKVENEVLGNLENQPRSRPWLQDFTASYLGAGNYRVYGKEEVEAQIKALYENGIREFLLWNAGNRYTQNVNYKLE